MTSDPNETTTGPAGTTHHVGPLALVGGGEWQPGTEFDGELLEASGGTEVLVLPTAAAYEHPERAVATATEWFARLGGTVRGLDVLRHADANLPEHAATVRDARFVYLSGGSPLHLLSVLKSSLVFDALLDAWHSGAVLAGSSAGAMVLADPMVDPRGGAFTVGLGLVEELAVVPHHDPAASQRLWRTLALAPEGIPVVGIPERTALVRSPDGTWACRGEGEVTVYLDGEIAGFESLPAERRERTGASRPLAERSAGACAVRRWPLGLGDVDLLDHDPLFGRARRAADAVDLRQHVAPGDHRAEERVERREAHAVGAGDDEELAAVRVRPGVRHGERAELVAARRGQLVLEAVPGAAGARPLRVAALDDEAGDDPVEEDPLEVVVAREEDEVVHRPRGGDGVEGEDHRPLRGDHLGGVALRQVDAHRRLPVEALGLRRGAVSGGALGSHRRLRSGGGLGDRDLVDVHVHGGGTRLGAVGPDLVHDVHAARDRAEDRVVRLGVEGVLTAGEHEEELAGVRRRA